MFHPTIAMARKIKYTLLYLKYYLNLKEFNYNSYKMTPIIYVSNRKDE